MVEDTARRCLCHPSLSLPLGPRRNTETSEESYSVVTSNHGKKCLKMKAMKRFLDRDIN